MIIKALTAIICFVGLASATCFAAEPPITAIAFTPNGQLVVTGSQAGVAGYHEADLKLLRRIDTRVGNIHDLAFSPNGTRLAIAGGEPAQEGLAEILHWPSGVAISLCQEQSDTVQSVSWIDDELLVTACLDQEVAICQAATGEMSRKLQGHSRGVTAVCFLPEARLIVSGGRDQSIRVWEHPTGEIVRTLNNHTGAVHDIAQRPAAEGLPMIASAGADRTVRLWQPTIGRMVRFAQLDATPLALAWLPDGSLLAAATTDGSVLLIDPDTAEVVHNLPAVEGWAYAVAVHPQGKKLAVGGRAGQLKMIALPDATN